jgi:hypothetical protein
VSEREYATCLQLANNALSERRLKVAATLLSGGQVKTQLICGCLVCLLGIEASIKCNADDSMPSLEAMA